MSIVYQLSNPLELIIPLWILCAYIHDSAYISLQKNCYLLSDDFWAKLVMSLSLTLHNGLMCLSRTGFSQSAALAEGTWVGHWSKIIRESFLFLMGITCKLQTWFSLFLAKEGGNTSTKTQCNHDISAGTIKAVAKRRIIFLIVCRVCVYLS